MAKKGEKAPEQPTQDEQSQVIIDILKRRHAVTLDGSDREQIRREISRCFAEQDAEITRLESRNAVLHDEKALVIDDQVRRLQCSLSTAEAVRDDFKRERDEARELHAACLLAHADAVKGLTELKDSATDQQQELVGRFVDCAVELLERPDAFLATFGPEPYQALKDLLSEVSVEMASALPHPKPAATSAPTPTSDEHGA